MHKCFHGGKFLLITSLQNIPLGNNRHDGRHIAIESCVCGYHTRLRLLDIWEAAIREEPLREREPRNTKDRYDTVINILRIDSQSYLEYRENFPTVKVTATRVYY